MMCHTLSKSALDYARSVVRDCGGFGSRDIYLCDRDTFTFCVRMSIHEYRQYSAMAA